MSNATIGRAKTRPTMVDVAHAAGVSVTTVSYVLGGRRGDHAASRISDETRERVARAVTKIGYRINEPARSLRRNRTDRVLLLIDRMSSPYDQHLATSLEAILGARGKSLSIMICPTLERLDNALGMVRRGLADGAIVQPRDATGQQEFFESYAREGIPMVVVEQGLKANGFDLVTNDEEPAITDAIDHLVARGHERIGFLAHAIIPDRPESRMVHVLNRLAFHGLTLSPEHVWEGARDRLAAHASTRRLLASDQPPTAIFSVSDTGAIAALWAALSMGRRVPDDVAIVGCGNVDECRITVPRISSSGPDAPDFGPVARLLLDRLEEPSRSEDRHLLLPWEFFPRQSS